MGLKKTNYVNEEYGVFLPEAYAIAEVDLKQNIATFHIAADREKAIAKKSVVKIPLRVKFARDINPYETAYTFAKSTVKHTELNEETQLLEVVESIMPFADWEDDIIKE